jgi:hypothetical protein
VPGKPAAAGERSRLAAPAVTAAARDAVEYWAAGVEASFDAAGDGPAPLHADRPIATREALRAYDPGLYELVDETMAHRGHVDWRVRPVRQAGPR